MQLGSLWDMSDWWVPVSWTRPHKCAHRTPPNHVRTNRLVQSRASEPRPTARFLTYRSVPDLALCSCQPCPEDQGTRSNTEHSTTDPEQPESFRLRRYGSLDGRHLVRSCEPPVIGGRESARRPGCPQKRASAPTTRAHQPHRPPEVRTQSPPAYQPLPPCEHLTDIHRHRRA